MPYTKTNWVAGVTPLSEANMDNLEIQYDEAMSDKIFTELWSAESAPSGAAAWEDWDVSTLVPAGTKSITVRIECPSTSADATAGVRNNGSALARLLKVHRDRIASIVVTNQVDGNRICERYASTGDPLCGFRVIGAWS